MDQQVIGIYLKDLRKDKGLTQEELADKVGVSRRTVSRWETGNNMPDIDLLIELAEFYEVDLIDLLKGTRKADTMEDAIKNTATAVAAYNEETTRKITRNFNLIFILSTLAMAVYFGILFLTPDGTENPVLDFIRGVCLGLGFGGLILGILMTSPLGKKLMEAKRKALGKD